MLGESPAGMPCSFEDAENVDAAIADALKSPKNRQTGRITVLVQYIATSFLHCGSLTPFWVLQSFASRRTL